MKLQEILSTISESERALKKHIKESVPLCDSIFRYQSEAYFDTFRKAKQLREAGKLPQLDWESEEMLGTDIGESVVLKGVGRVWLDVPYLDESDELEESNPNQQASLYNPDGTTYRQQKMPHLDPKDPINKAKGFSDVDDNDLAYDQDLDKDVLDSQMKKHIAKMLDTLNPAERQVIALRFGIGGGKDHRLDQVSDILNVSRERVRQIEAKALRKLRYQMRGGDVREAEYQGKDVELNKPKRGGSKKFYVYTKNPKTGKVKKVSFGADSGGGSLAVKLKDPKARKAFADRHNCDQKNDKTKAGYWSCRLPRYAKSLGLSGGGTWW